MMSVYKFVNVVAFATILLLDLTSTTAQLCRCIRPGLYEGFDAADVVLHGTALNGCESVGIFNGVSYTLDTITLYKEEPRVTYDQEIVFNTTSGGCGVRLEVGEEYLIGLHRTSHNSFTTSICNLFWEWSSISDEDKESLEAGCNDDPCDEACGEFQECLFYPVGSPGEYYCADTCDPSPCARGEVCTLEEVECVRAPCPPVANCTVSSH